MANNPPIIIADEPLGNLDSVNAKMVLEFLKELNEKDGRTIIMVTHEAWSLRDVKTIFHMKDGEIIDEEKIESGNIPSTLSKHLNEQISSMSGDVDKKDIPPERVTARILANFLLRGYSMDEIIRFESLVNDRFDNKIDKKEFIKVSSKSFKDGGVGLRKNKVEKVTDYIEGIINKRKDVERIYNFINESNELPIRDEINNIRDWLLEGYTGKLSNLQVLALDQVISDRTRGFIKSDKVVETLDLSNSKFGVGLSFRAAHLISEKLELILNDDKEEVVNNDEPLKKL